MANTEQALNNQYRKKPVVISAVQWDGTEQGCQRIKATFKQLETLAKSGHLTKPEVTYWRIGTLEGGHEVTPGDWIIQGVKGELYPCKPDIFAMTYEPVTAASAEAATPVAWIVDVLLADKWVPQHPARPTKEAAEQDAMMFKTPYKRVTPLYTAAPQASQPIGQTAEDYLRSKYGAYRGHHAWRELEAAFNAGKVSNSQPVSGAELTQIRKQITEAAAALVHLPIDDDELHERMLVQVRKIADAIKRMPLLSASGQARQSEKATWDAALDAAARAIRDRALGEEIFVENALDEIEALKRGDQPVNAPTDWEKAYSEWCERPLLKGFDIDDIPSAIWTGFHGGFHAALASTPAQQTEAPVNVPSGWSVSVQECDDESILRIQSPDGRMAVFTTVRGNPKSQVLQELSIALAAAPASVEQQSNLIPSNSTELEAQQSEKDEDFYRGVIAALGALRPHSAHGSTFHDEIVRSVGKKQLYAVAEQEDVEWAGLDPEFYAAIAKEQAKS